MLCSRFSFGVMKGRLVDANETLMNVDISWSAPVGLPKYQLVCSQSKSSWTPKNSKYHILRNIVESTFYLLVELKITE